MLSKMFTPLDMKTYTSAVKYKNYHLKMTTTLNMEEIYWCDKIHGECNYSLLAWHQDMLLA